MLGETKMWTSTGLKVRFNVENLSDQGRVGLRSESDGSRTGPKVVKEWEIAVDHPCEVGYRL